MLTAFRAISVFLLLATTPSDAQLPRRGPDRDRDGPRLKQSQVEEILKSDHAKSIEDSGKLLDLAEELKAEIEKNDRHVLSVSAYKKAEEIEKLAKRIRGRMKRF